MWYAVPPSLRASLLHSLRHAEVLSVFFMYISAVRYVLQSGHQESKNRPMLDGSSAARKSCRQPTGRMSASM